MKTIAEIKAWLTGKAVEQNAETPETQSAPTVEELSAIAGELQEKQTSLETRETDLTTLATTLAGKQTELATLEASLATKASVIDTKEQNTKALATVIGNVTAPIKPEKTNSNVVAAYNEETDATKRFQLFRKNRKELEAAN